MGLLLKHDRENCIGCTACEAIAPEHWVMNEDGKADIKGGKRLENGWEEKEIPEDQMEDNKLAAEGCPVNVIHIKKDGEDII